MSSGSFNIRLADAGREFESRSDEFLLDAAQRAGVFLPYGCRSGACGACRARLMAGEIGYEFDPPALTAEERAAGYVLLCLAQPRSDLVLQARELPRHEAIQVRNLPARVETRELLAADVLKLVIRLPKGDPFDWLPGQYVDLLLEGDEHLAGRRSFSIANAPRPWTGAEYPRIELHLRLAPGGRFTEYAFREMPEKSMLRLEGPLGGFFLREDASRPRLFIAGGTGFAPIKAMLEDWLPRSQGQSAHLFWGARGEKDLYIPDLPRSWVDMYQNFRFTPVLSAPDSSWRGARGWVHEQALAEYPNLAGTDVYASGPPPMIDAIRHEFIAAGLPIERLFFDSFDYSWVTWPRADR